MTARQIPIESSVCNGETYYVAVAENGPWLTQDGGVTDKWDERGLWVSEEEAAKALAKSFEV